MNKLFAIAVLLCFVSVRAALSTELTILTENLPALNYLENGVLVGPSVEIVKEIQKRTGSYGKIKVYPWARAYRIALEEENVVLFSTTLTEERRDKFKWVGPLALKRDVLVARKGAGIAITTLDDAKKVKRIGTVRNDSKEEYLQQQGFTNLEPVSDDKKNAQKLILGRIDLWVHKVPGLRSVCELARVDYNDVEEVYSLRKIELMIAFSKQTSDLIVQKWKNAFNDMAADGTILKIQRKWNRLIPDPPFPELPAKP
ncbi:MAG: transporter substrate-binding domain-containing protein [Thermodesulfobacteriota bacterium]